MLAASSRTGTTIATVGAARLSGTAKAATCSSAPRWRIARKISQATNASQTLEQSNSKTGPRQLARQTDGAWNATHSRRPRYDATVNIRQGSRRSGAVSSDSIHPNRPASGRQADRIGRQPNADRKGACKVVGFVTLLMTRHDCHCPTGSMEIAA